MPFAFLSHSSKDSEVVEKLAARLGKEKVYYDKWNLDAGELLPASLSEAIFKSKWFIILASKASMESRWVKLEVNVALIKWIEDRNYRIIVARIDECEVHAELKPFFHVNCPGNAEKAIDEIVRIVNTEGRDIPTPERSWKRDFVNRYEELSSVEEAAYEGSRFVLLLGTYGLGKSTLANLSAKKVFGFEILRLSLTEGHDMLRTTLELASAAKLPLPEPSAGDYELRRSAQDSISQLSKQSKIVLFDDVELALDDDGSPRDYLLNILMDVLKAENIPPVFLSSTIRVELDSDLRSKTHIIPIRPLSDSDIVHLLEQWIEADESIEAIPDRDCLIEIAGHLFGYPLAARLASNLIRRFSAEEVLKDIKHFTQLRVDIAKQLLGKTRVLMSKTESDCLEILTIAQTGLSQGELESILKIGVDMVRNAVDNLFSSMMLTLEDGRLQVIPLVRDYFWTRSYSTGNWRKWAELLAEHAQYEILSADEGSEDFVRYCSRAYRLLTLVGRRDDARRLVYHFEGELRDVARRLYHAKEYETALKYADFWLEFKERDNRIRWLRARCLTRLDRYDEAEAELERLEKTTYSRHMIEHAWGLLSRERGDIESAAIHFKKGLDDRPNFLPLLRDYGDALDRLGETDKALEVLEHAFEIAPRDPYVVPKLADILSKVGKQIEALELIRGVATAFPEEAAYEHRISMLLYEQGVFEEACTHARKAVDLNPKLYEAVLHLAALEIRMDNLDRASELLKKLPERLSYRIRQVRDIVLAELELKRGKYSSARRHLEGYDPLSNSYRADVLCRIELSDAEDSLNRGLKDLATECYERGRAVLDKSLEMYPTNQPLNILLSQYVDLEKKLKQ